MAKMILALNAGSSSIKFAVFAIHETGFLPGQHCRGEIEDIGGQTRFFMRTTVEQPDNHKAVRKTISARNHAEALEYILNWLEENEPDLQFIAVGHRVVHGGTHFRQPVKVDAVVMQEMEMLIPLAPLHQPHALRAIKALTSLRPGIPQVACFDTGFHTGMPRVEQIFALPRELEMKGIRHYGFHGLSYESIAFQVPKYLGDASEGRVVVAHLGHGVSLCAMQKRKSIATSMSFTPLDGLPMGTRCGAIDPAIVLYLLREEGMTPDEVSDLLNHQSGLLGMSGISGDMSTLIASQCAEATEAIDAFVYRVGREIASLAAAMGGLDALVFTAGIGEHSIVMRARICHAAAWLGVKLDDTANHAGGPCISMDRSTVSAWVIPTNEEQVIARHTATLIGIQ